MYERLRLGLNHVVYANSRVSPYQDGSPKPFALASPFYPNPHSGATPNCFASNGIENRAPTLTVAGRAKDISQHDHEWERRQGDVFPCLPRDATPSVAEARDLETVNRQGHIGFGTFDALPDDLI